MSDLMGNTEILSANSPSTFALELFMFSRCLSLTLLRLISVKNQRKDKKSINQNKGQTGEKAFNSRDPNEHPNYSLDVWKRFFFFLSIGTYVSNSRHALEIIDER